MTIDYASARETLLKNIDGCSKAGAQRCDARILMQGVSEQLGIRGKITEQQAILTMFHDLFRTGHLAWGLDEDNPSPPYFHITEQGRKALIAFSKDPVNPDGYLSFLKSSTPLSPVTNSYITEALKTYTSDCFKAAAVMVGCAAESVVLELRDVLVEKLTSQRQTIPDALHNWRIKTVLDAIADQIEARKNNMDRPLRESCESFWPGFTGHIRRVRNDAGHPLSIEPVTPETVHAALLLFPELAKLAQDIKEWIKSNKF